MRPLARRSLLVLLASTLAFAATMAPATASSRAPWQDPVLPMSPDPSSTNNQLNAVSATSATDIWAVGYYQDDSTGAYDTLILHWDGAAWTQVSAPDPSSTDNRLESVRAVSPTNAWAVGFFVNDTTHADDTLILHWNGTVWSKVGSPNPSATANILSGVAISSTSAKSGWAVGYFDNGKTHVTDTLTLRWNGSTWSHVAGADPSPENYLNGVRAPSPTNAWAVGYCYNGTRDVTLIEHWNGRAWSRVASPAPSASENVLNATSGVSPTNAWAVGSFYNGTRDVTLVLHWNGSAWSRVNSPSPISGSNGLRAVRAVSATDAWAVGNGGTDTLILHWNGRDWSMVPSPSPGSAYNSVWGVTATSATNAWAVGAYVDSTGTFTLILHWNGTAWSEV